MGPNTWKSQSARLGLRSFVTLLTYSPDLAPYDFHVLSPTKVKRALQNGHISPMKIGRENGYRMLNGNISTKDMEQFVPRYDKCLNKLNDYVNKKEAHEISSARSRAIEVHYEFVNEPESILDN
ncbi:hypothetical protein V1478_002982 [Vespula squamosa]|uniref:Uncharacterized protein n=1 Tax=Vespula squamosa TaxID=30214 RepID=A0ABD2BRE0_VESSQ